MKIDPVGFNSWLAQVNFAEHGDRYEKKYCALVLPDLPLIEAFWRAFVVPLTMRLHVYPGLAERSIRYRPGIEECLQHICGANYSVYLNLAFAKSALASWDEEQSLESVYTRLSSTFDVFESLCFTFCKLLCSCQGSTLGALNRLDESRTPDMV